MKLTLTEVRLQTEAQLQAASAKWLELKLPKAFIAIHVPNEGRRGGKWGRIDGARQKAAGLKAGCPDWLIMGGGGPYGTPRKGEGYHFAACFAVELKVKGTYPSPAQKAFHARLAAAGVPVAVCRSLDEIETALKGWGVI